MSSKQGDTVGDMALLAIWIVLLSASAYLIAHPWVARKRENVREGRAPENYFSYTGTLHSYTVQDDETLLLYLEDVSVATEYGQRGQIVGDLSITQRDRLILGAPYDEELVELCNRWVVEEAGVRVERVEKKRRMLALSISDLSGRGITKATPAWVAQRRV